SKPAALNLGIRQARGDVVVRLDVHAEYPPDRARAARDARTARGARARTARDAGAGAHGGEDGG
ncbi:glycosyltransferase, partial [Actinoplanes missouriensis]|uniref:glycosyltransferase n=1 Tax=Actinoplanes missouriensis TaxID=1866 RepID=UPI0033ECC781